MLKVSSIRGHSFLENGLFPGSVVVDLGMNTGSFAAAVRARYGCEVIGLEPNPMLASKLQAHLAGVTCANAAISDRSGTLDFYLDNDNSEASTFHLNRTSKHMTPIEVTCIGIGDFLKTIGRPIGLLKMDVEGEEINLFGHFGLYRDVNQISVEFHIRNHPYHKDLVKRILRDARNNAFYCFDFSHNFEDVLFVNQTKLQVTRADRAAFLLFKSGLFLSKAAKWLQRRISASHRGY